jgi:predicted PurR-regulated permease PerM
MPPAVSLLAIVAFGLLFGVWGVLLATPLAVVTIRIVRMAYVEDVLEEKAAG